MTEKITPFGLNIIGFASANVGLGNSLRQFVDCFLNRGEKVSILDIEAGGGRSGFDKSLEQYFISSANNVPFAVNLSIFGAHDIPRFALSPPNGLPVNNRLNVFFVWWELTSLPQHWIEAAKVFDVLIAGSDFVYALLSNNITGIPILRAPHPVSIPANILPNRKRYRLPESKFIVYMGFDPHSSIDRKNPYAAIDAFKLAFPNSPDCHLAIKVNYSSGDERIKESVNHFLEYIGSDSRIHLIQENLTYYDLLCLYASCDAFISLHRSEGLGLVPFEAMRLGKPVVATAWSGNMSYMNYTNSCLVQFDLVPIEANTLHYGSNELGFETKWAEPSISQAAAWLKKLAEDTEFRLQLGIRAAADANQHHELACKTAFVDELKAIWENREFLPQRDRQLFINQARESIRRFDYEQRLRKMTPFQRFVHKVQNKFDRHLLWRFRKN
ncbi:glycosyltransferase family 4 protein [Methylomonas montana]|uniref:glycosyltransferase family 4 protein n=1 Tax=Methylomonas montana TaxID=3058963 RepID=UPI002658CE13|nr:glycosyltransferase family 4 protein [Methylomonas montana]WKJ88723.1 glycosyltransferase family 4 protein [Methylomonas montana]